MGLFTRRSGFEFDAVTADGVTYDAVTDDDGVVYLVDYDEDYRVWIDGVIIGDYWYPAHTDEYGRVYLDED
ncbi:hypothetical protein [Streptacidiphilus sp. MAP5-52]|uniref:hypothetical protein n=1 Tax=Streptacidiphilus sp. MAP5-52 TaxID=3156267 RepID=UPI003514F428